MAKYKSLFEKDAVFETHGGGLVDKFGIPPFSVLDARQGEWQDRKAAWLSLGMDRVLGRAENLLRFSAAAKDPRYFKEKVDQQNRDKARGGNGKAKGSAEGATLRDDPVSRKINTSGQTGTSSFDPVLCELMYKWFVPKGGFVFDPFVGGCCAGIVASKLGYKYLGTDIRPEQVEANNEQAQRICKTNTPKYVVCDARSSAKVVKPESLDCIYSCPPYVDLEQYSNDPQDISTLKWDKFEPEYSGIIESVVTRLKLNRFAIFVVGEVRGKDGNCVGFVPGTINAFQRAGLHLYNDAIRLTMLGSLSIRAGRPFNATRKLGRTHQHVLIFLKGSADKAVAAIKESGN